MSSLLLAVDTSGKAGSLALARLQPDQNNIVVLEVVPLAGGAFSAELVPQIAELLKKHSSNKCDLEAFAVASGPGSFTGLRVGLAGIKALAEALQKPIVAISVLEAIAWSTETNNRIGEGSTKPHGHILALLDAGRGDVYVGDYERYPSTHSPSDMQLRMHSERILNREEFVRAAKSNVVATHVVTPDPRWADIARSGGIDTELIRYPDSTVIARMAWERLQRGETIGPAELQANYIRRSDAEIFSKPAQR
jgi:tRNA threonylcarbamoyladenosine biosynthesis protein TsaB